MSISLCIPTYQRHVSLRKAILSALEKDNRKNVKEILVVDDCPSSPAKKYIADILRANPKLTYILNKKNIGLDANFNKCMQRATGDWILFLSDDDELLPGAIQKIQSVVKQQSTCGIVLGAKIIRNKGVFTGIERATVHTQYIPPTKPNELADICFDAMIVSGLVLNKKLLDFSVYDQFLQSLFAHLTVVGFALLKAGGVSMSEPVVIHEVENEVHWSYKQDFQAKEMTDIARSFVEINSEFADALERRIMKNFSYIFIAFWMKPKIIYSFLRSLYNSKLLNIESALGFFEGFFFLTKRKIMSILSRSEQQKYIGGNHL